MKQRGSPMMSASIGNKNSKIQGGDSKYCA
jgi:hypothetical protein